MSKFKQPLGYDLNALEPHLSEEQMRFHYEQHYTGYCKNLEKLIKDTVYADMNLTQIVSHTEPPPIKRGTDPIYNNAAQIKNHEFFFEQLSKDGGQMDDELKQAIESSFGSTLAMKTALRNKVTTFFGAGWVWLSLIQHKEWDSPSLTIITTRDGDTITFNESDNVTYYGPLLTIDVWEHAHYVDYRNDKGKYFDNIYKLINWNVVNERYKAHISTRFDYTKPFEL